MAAKGAKSTANLQARIKKMMQSDEDVGKVSKASPVLIARTLQVFLQHLVDGAAQIAETRGARVLTQSHIKALVERDEVLDFLKDAVAAVPALPPEGAEAPKPARQKRPRIKSESDEGGPAKTRGRGRQRGRGGKGRQKATEEVADGGADAAAQAADDDGLEQQAGASDTQQQAFPSAATKTQEAQRQEGADMEQALAGTAGGEQQQEQPLQPASEAHGIHGSAESLPDVPSFVNVPSFMAAAAGPGAEAEQEDYDEEDG